MERGSIPRAALGAGAGVGVGVYQARAPHLSEGSEMVRRRGRCAKFVLVDGKMHRTIPWHREQPETVKPSSPDSRH